MVTIIRFVKALILLAALISPLLAWAVFKPVRVLVPQWAGVECYSSGVCTDDASFAAEAARLKTEAVAFVQQKLGRIERVPRVIFCASAACEASFGFGANASYNVGTSGAVVSRRGRHDYYLRHELIHHVQAERLGAARLWLATPTWFIEGMAYSISEDPRHPLAEPFESFRAQYENWASQQAHGDLWSRAREL
ncbi:hypothetical protein [Ramlibacter alkalitolerans]|uniref:Transmembrane protein n=1 Tax=Ramlibacter alkalitolerans TaxID=2039631 RepID=A0ABS1JWA2_9BURK|nr:hypothetical protein [Ramlibacter alkalitolerans]MBL0428487.1 hypothetical protein [Ramlibacter alkalitolerans]